jgi:periplasmic protein TonB
MRFRRQPISLKRILVQLSKYASLDWRDWQRPMVFAIGASIVLHIIFLAFKWHEDNEKARRLKTPLSVVLVNARSTTAPVNPKRLAQADLNGGGELKDAQASALRRADPQLAEKLEKMQAEQKRLLSQMKDGHANSSSTVNGKKSVQQTESNPLEAELAKRLQKDGQVPRRAVVTATSAKSVVFAHYYDAMRKQIEAYGTTHFPRVQGKALYGSLVVMVSVDQQGRLSKDGVTVMKSSGNQELDRQAIAIIRSAGPFGRFTDRMRRQIDVLDWVSTFEFTRDGAELK